MKLVAALLLLVSSIAAADCPTASADLKEGDGMRAIDHAMFHLDVESVKQLEYPLNKVTLGDVIGNMNRSANRVTKVPGNVPGLKSAFEWDKGDEQVADWTPQGVTGSFDAKSDGLVGKTKLLLISWYSKADKGVRIAIVDAATLKYRFALLVSPVMIDGKPSFEAVKVHAGGLAWVGERLYVPVTKGGFRVFDLAHILEISNKADSLGVASDGSYAAFGYDYAIPELERYNAPKVCAPLFSFVSYDRGTSSLISGEYEAKAITGRLYRWPLGEGGALEAKHGVVTASEVWMMGESHIQGALEHDGVFLLSSSRPKGVAGELDRVGENKKTKRFGWSNSPEDLAYDQQDATVWSLSESEGARYVFEAELSAFK